MTAAEDFQAHLDYLSDATNLGYWFIAETFNALSTLIPNDPIDLATYQTRINNSTLLTTEEKAEALTAVNFYETAPVRYLRKFLPSYYGNARELIRTFALLCAGYYENSNDHPNIENLYNIYVATEEYLMSDEDEYKIPQFLNVNLNLAKDELIAEINEVNANE